MGTAERRFWNMSDWASIKRIVEFRHALKIIVLMAKQGTADKNLVADMAEVAQLALDKDAEP